MKNTEIVEVSFMYNRVEELTEPKEVLEALSKLECEMGWSDVTVIRYGAYGLWLKEHGKDDWFKYLIELKDLLSGLQAGVLKCPSMDTPEGWIAPVPYFKGQISKK